MNPYKNFLDLMDEAKKQQTDVVADSEDFQVLTSFGLMNSTFAIVNMPDISSILQLVESCGASIIKDRFLAQVINDLNRKQSIITKEIKDSTDFLTEFSFWMVFLIISPFFFLLGFVVRTEDPLTSCYLILLGAAIVLYPIFILMLVVVDLIHHSIQSNYCYLLKNINCWSWRGLAKSTRMSLYLFTNSTDSKYCKRCKNSLNYAINKGVIQNVRFVESSLISSDELGDIEIIKPEEDKPVEGLEIAEPVTARY